MNNNIAGFDSQGFFDYLKQNFSGFENHYLYELVENILESSPNYMSGTDELLEYFKAIFPEIEFGEIAIFVDDDYLTDEGKKQKHIYRTAYEADELWERQRDIESGRDSEYQNMTEFFNGEFPALAVSVTPPSKFTSFYAGLQNLDSIPRAITCRHYKGLSK